jgi:peptidoglycan/xylan/chitin deacetylase (PgdA/CDA1 family)
MSGRGIHGFLRSHVRVMSSVLGVTTDEPVVVLTYDDGPEPGQTERVLGALAEKDATATFFVLVGRAQRSPAMVRDIVGAGHEVALHGPDHRALNDFSPAEVTARTAAARDALQDITGVEVRWMRPPYGRQSLRTYRAIRRTGLIPVLWGATSRDSVDLPDVDRLAFAMQGATKGTILLCHDGRAGPDDGVDDGEIPPFDRGALTRRILDGFAERGLRGVSLEKALEAGNPRRGAWFG